MVVKVFRGIYNVFTLIAYKYIAGANSFLLEQTHFQKGLDVQ